MHPRTMARRGRQLAAGGALIGAAIGAGAQQEPAPPVGLERVVVTGSNIPRTDVETALPVQVITREEIERTGSSTVAEFMTKVSANVLGYNEQLSGGPFAANMSSINLRGIGLGDTLVLLNGRRIANAAFDGSAVDVNSIPVAAIDRVEILKDGASAIYGTDAIAGVVNFILRKDFTGLEASAFGSWPVQGGGEQYQAVITAGVGNLAQDKYNVFVSATWQKDEPLYAADRSFSRATYLPEAGINRLSTSTFPANILYRGGKEGEGPLYNPSYATGCAPPDSLPTRFPLLPGEACGFDAAAYVTNVHESEHAAVFGRGTLRLATNHELFIELAYASNRLTVVAAPTPVSQSTNPGQVPILYPAGGPYYPTAFAAEHGISGDLNVFYRAMALGPRIGQTDGAAWRAVAGAEGQASGWDYSAALSYSRNDQSSSLVSGFASFQRMVEAMATGLINPFGDSTPQGDALLAGTRVAGRIRDATGSTVDLLLSGSRQLASLAGGPLAIALGAEARGEQMANNYTSLVSGGDVLGVPFALQSASGSRNVQAVFAEASVPFAQGFEAQLAARYDHYSDFGGTWNPKLALRWQPARNLLLRTSWGTGFRAPPLYDLYTPQESTYVSFEDPLRCPVTGAPQDCETAPAVYGGNPHLQPETSTQFNAGIVWEPASGFSLSVDYWRISKENLIGSLAPETIADNMDRFGSTNIIRGPVDPQYPGLPGPIQKVVLTQQNLGNLVTSGFDVDFAWHGPATGAGRFSVSLNGTYIAEWKFQADGVNYESAVGRNTTTLPGPFPRWRHYAAVDWTSGPWGATLGQTYQSGYEDANFFPGVINPPAPRQVASYSVWNLQASYAGFRNTTIVLGVKNLFDRDPPFTNQLYWFQVGYDPTYADPRGRALYARLTYAF